MNLKQAIRLSKICQIILLITTIQLFTSCTSYKKIPYFLDIPDSAYIFKEGKVLTDSNTLSLFEIKSKDILQVKIYTADGYISNIGTSSNKVYGRSEIVSNVSGVEPIGGSIDYNYEVNSAGDIQIPSIGTIKVAGLSLEQAQNKIYQQVILVLNKPVVVVKIANFKITILGEVNKPGTYLIDGERINLLDALGMAGDMTVFGKRNNVLLLHKINDKETRLIRFNLNSSTSLNSTYFNLRQNDIVYVEPNKGKAAANDASQIRTYAIISTLASIVLAIIYNLRK